MRRSNTTFVNLRAALDDVDPLVDASKPVAQKLQPFLDELRPLASDARPTIRDLSNVVRSEGADNDLLDLDEDVPAARRDSARHEDAARLRRRRRTSASARRVPRDRDAHARRRADHRPRPPVHARPVRLVRRLLDHRRLRRARRLLARADRTSTPSHRRHDAAASGRSLERAARSSSSSRRSASTSAARAPPRRPRPTARTSSREEEQGARLHRGRPSDGAERMRRRARSRRRRWSPARARSSLTGAPSEGRRASVQDRVRQRVRPDRGRRPAGWAASRAGQTTRRSRCDASAERATRAARRVVDGRDHRAGLRVVPHGLRVRHPPAVADRRVLRRLPARAAARSCPTDEHDPGRADHLDGPDRPGATTCCAARTASACG